MAKTPLLCTSEVARWLALSVPTVRRLMRSGQLLAYKVAGKWRYEERAVEDLLDRSPVYSDIQKQKRRGHGRGKDAGNNASRT